MANSPNYTATKEDSRPWRTDNDTRANAADEASMDNQTALASLTTARARYDGVRVTPGTGALSVGAPTLQLTAVVEAGVKNLGVTWSTSHPARATVNGSGLVTRVGAGAVVITATSVEDSSKTGFANITVS